MPSNQQNLLLMVQVLYLLEVFTLTHYGPSSTETLTTTIVKQLNLFNKYLLLLTFETNDNYSIRFEISNNSSTIRFKMRKHYSYSTTVDKCSLDYFTLQEITTHFHSVVYTHLLSDRSVLLPTSTMITSFPRSVRTSSIHLDV